MRENASLSSPNNDCDQKNVASQDPQGAAVVRSTELHSWNTPSASSSMVALASSDKSTSVSEPIIRPYTAVDAARIYHTYQQSLHLNQRSPTPAPFLNFAQNAKKPEKRIHRPGSKPIPPRADEWDSQGAKLVSRALHLTTLESEFGEIADLYNRLKGQPCHLHGAIASAKTGLHIHVEAVDSSLDHRTLKHLLYILVMYEKQIDTLHPEHRRTSSKSDSAVNELKSSCGNFHLNDESSNEYLPLDEVRRMIFGYPQQSLEQLTGDEKCQAVRITSHGLKSDHSRTVEFRQHESVLRGEMIRYWVLFCAGLVRLANYMAHELTAEEAISGTTDGRGYPFRHWDDSMSVFDLLDAMELEPDARAYFTRRAAYSAFDSLPGPPSQEQSYIYPVSHMERLDRRYEWQ
ncbi:hypothetical protein MMC13_004406 [Lambiella insularis]|nr:hypothetical protein [Lambiella insularis]